jgi:hypothetical protein
VTPLERLPGRRTASRCACSRKSLRPASAFALSSRRGKASSHLLLEKCRAGQRSTKLAVPDLSHKELSRTWSKVEASNGKRLRIRPPRKRLKQAESVALGCGAIPQRYPHELTSEEGRTLIERVAAFGALRRSSSSPAARSAAPTIYLSESSASKIPIWYASTTAWARSRRSSFWKMCVTCVLTVVLLMKRSWAISPFERPAAMSRNNSRSRPVSSPIAFGGSTSRTTSRHHRRRPGRPRHRQRRQRQRHGQRRGRRRQRESERARRHRRIQRRSPL